MRGYYLVYSGAGQVARTLDPVQALDALEEDLRLTIAVKARRRIFVHAGVVGWRGRAIVLPGRSFAGKSTLVAALVRAGATYYSDEYAVFDEAGRVHPYPRPLGIRPQTGGRAELVPVEKIGGIAGRGPLPVGVIADLRYAKDKKGRQRPLTPGQALLALLNNTVVARSAPARALACLRQATLGASAFAGTRGEATDAAEELLARLA